MFYLLAKVPIARKCFPARPLVVDAMRVKENRFRFRSVRLQPVRIGGWHQ
jgi:hypothetical protein